MWFQKRQCNISYSTCDYVQTIHIVQINSFQMGIVLTVTKSVTIRFLWGYIKSNDYLSKPWNLDKLKASISSIIADISFLTVQCLWTCCREEYSLLGYNIMQFVLSCWYLGQFIWHWRWRWYVPQKHWFTFNGLHGVISHKIVLLITSAVRTSNWTCFIMLDYVRNILVHVYCRNLTLNSSYLKNNHTAYTRSAKLAPNL
jgi:hypothetical protein